MFQHGKKHLYNIYYNMLSKKHVAAKTIFVSTSTMGDLTHFFGSRFEEYEASNNWLKLYRGFVFLGSVALAVRASLVRINILFFNRDLNIFSISVKHWGHHSSGEHSSWRFCLKQTKGVVSQGFVPTTPFERCLLEPFTMWRIPPTSHGNKNSQFGNHPTEVPSKPPNFLHPFVQTKDETYGDMNVYKTCLEDIFS